MDMTLKRLGGLVCMLFCMGAVLFAKVERTTVYMFGFSASFTDSLAYITGIQQIDSAYIDTKTDFLLDRVVYSDQLQTFVETANLMPDCTCAVFFNTKKSKLVEEYNELRKHYEKESGIVLKDLPGGQFKFQAPSYIPSGAEEKKTKEREKAEEASVEGKRDSSEKN